MPTIIIQEPDAGIRDVLKIALEVSGFRVIAVASCGDYFMEMIANVQPCVVLLDFNITGMDCIEKVQDVREKYPLLPVLALSFKDYQRTL